MLLGPPEEIALCALSTHTALATASFNPGTYTSLLIHKYSPTELLLLRTVFFCLTLSTHRYSAPWLFALLKHTQQCNFQVRLNPAMYYNQSLRDMYCCFNRTDFYYSLLSPPLLHYRSVTNVTEACCAGFVQLMFAPAWAGETTHLFIYTFY